ncbi:hypothetical protein Lal_00035273 [Lupinus albus]|nr:hypothetical protein Lal_00035273 [Lupinus albus]
MTIINNIGSDFSDEEDIDICSDDKDVKFDSDPSISVNAHMKDVLVLLVIQSHIERPVLQNKWHWAKFMVTGGTYNELPRWMNTMQYLSPRQL